ncbi:hypothetical protein [Actinoplanes sp. GCM10030250]|uniref:hypothetical protein n=1 Tax=Actinoplanes sp. GCM10030250 TaxID=3273376 RepID=UPI0036086DEC
MAEEGVEVPLIVRRLTHLPRVPPPLGVLAEGHVPLGLNQLRLRRDARPRL